MVESAKISRAEVHDALMDLVKILRDEHEASLTDIAWVMIAEACDLVAQSYDESDYEPDDSGTTEEDEYDEFGYLGRVLARHNLSAEEINSANEITSLSQSKNYKYIYSMEEKIQRFDSLDRYKEQVPIMEELFEKLPEIYQQVTILLKSLNNVSLEAELSSHVFNPLTSVFYHWRALIQAYVVQQDTSGLDRILQTTKKLDLIRKNPKIDVEIVDHEIKKAYQDMLVFKKIYDYIRENPNTPQNKISTTLSLDGRRAQYPLNWAEKLGVISRTPYKGTYLLKIN